MLRYIFHSYILHKGVFQSVVSITSKYEGAGRVRGRSDEREGRKIGQKREGGKKRKIFHSEKGGGRQGGGRGRLERPTPCPPPQIWLGDGICLTQIPLFFSTMHLVRFFCLPRMLRSHGSLPSYYCNPTDAIRLQVLS